MMLLKRVSVIMIMSIFILSTSATTNVQAMNSYEEHYHEYSYDDFRSKSIIVKLNGDIDINQYDSVNNTYIDENIIVLDFNSIEDAMDCYEEIKDKKEVLYAEPNLYIELNEEDKSDSEEIEVINNQKHVSWGVSHLNIDSYAEYISGHNIENEIHIAVIDSGVDYNHPIFKDKLLDNGYDFINNDNDVLDDHFSGHGTHVAGIIADAAKYIDNIKIMPIKALNSAGFGTVAVLRNSIYYAIENNVDIINLSLGFRGGFHSEFIEEAIRDAVAKGIVVINAAGNEKSDTINSCPSHLEEAIVVSSIDRNNNKSYTSNYGSAVDFAAPGDDIYSANIGGGYVYKSGTSMAAPYISVVAAMIKSINPDASPQEIEERIKEISVDIGESGRDIYFGHGVPDMKQLLPEEQIDNDLSYEDDLNYIVEENIEIDLNLIEDNRVEEEVFNDNKSDEKANEDNIENIEDIDSDNINIIEEKTRDINEDDSYMIEENYDDIGQEDETKSVELIYLEKIGEDSTPVKEQYNYESDIAEKELNEQDINSRRDSYYVSADSEVDDEVTNITKVNTELEFNDIGVKKGNNIIAIAALFMTAAAVIAVLILKDKLNKE